MDLVNAGAEISTKLGISVPAAFNLLNESGLTVGQMFKSNGQLSQQALTDIENLARGYQVMAGNTTALGQNINAVNFSTGVAEHAGVETELGVGQLHERRHGGHVIHGLP